MSKATNIFKSMGSFFVRLGKIIIFPFAAVGRFLRKGFQKIGKKRARWLVPFMGLIIVISFLIFVYPGKEMLRSALVADDEARDIEAVIILEGEGETDELTAIVELVPKTLDLGDETAAGPVPEAWEKPATESADAPVPVLVHPQAIEPIPTFTLNDLLAPITGDVITPFGWHFHPVFKDWRFHRGIDIQAVSGTPVCAVWAGKVVEIKEDDYLGTVLVVDHSNDLKTIYGHLEKINMTVGNRVKKGDQLGTVAQTDLSAKAHLHFELHHKGVALDPGPYYTGWLGVN